MYDSRGPGANPVRGGGRGAMPPSLAGAMCPKPWTKCPPQIWAQCHPFVTKVQDFVQERPQMHHLGGKFLGLRTPRPHQNIVLDSRSPTQMLIGQPEMKTLLPNAP